MRKADYNNITIEQIEQLSELGFFSEIICDADELKVELLEEEMRKLEIIIEYLANILKFVTDMIAGINADNS